MKWRDIRELISAFIAFRWLIVRINSYFRSYNWVVHEEWDDDLIWHPSQCYKKIEVDGNHYVIYLRWRWDDPWTAELVDCGKDGKFDIRSEDVKRTPLDVGYFKSDELEELKMQAEKKVYHHIFLNQKK